jgi:hypothetical protein
MGIIAEGRHYLAKRNNSPRHDIIILKSRNLIHMQTRSSALNYLFHIVAFPIEKRALFEALFHNTPRATQSANAKQIHFNETQPSSDVCYNRRPECTSLIRPAANSVAPLSRRRSTRRSSNRRSAIRIACDTIVVSVCKEKKALHHDISQARQRAHMRHLPLLAARPGLALVANNGVEFDFNRVSSRIASISLSPIVADGVGEAVALCVEGGGGNAAADLGVAFEAVLCVFVPKVEGAV